MTTRRSSRSGFTLVEAIATIVVISTIAAGGAGIVSVAVRSYADGAAGAELHAKASVAMERITRELRATPLDADNTPDIAQLASGSITWDGGAKSLRLSGSEILLTDDGAEHVLLGDVAALRFTAYDGENSPLTLPLSGVACDPVRRIGIEIESSRGSAADRIQTKVFLRCMMLESLP